MLSIRSWLTLMISLTMLGLSTNAYTGEQTLSVTMSWNGEGTLYSTGVDEMTFKGALEGIMYTVNADGDLNAAFAECPIDVEINKKSQTSMMSGNCEVTGAGGDVVYADLSCSGKPGICIGTFTLTGGTGRFAGVTGASKMVFRSVVSSLVTEMASGSRIKVANGIAILPKLAFSIPGQ